jgi:chemotaxis protein methyltransferase CheR
MADGGLSRDLFLIFAALVEEEAGLHYADAERNAFGDRILARAQDAGFESLLDYYYFLRYDPASSAERTALIESLLVHETYFFREERALRAVVDGALRPAIERGVRPRVWCAAASTGEEPLSLAMLLDEGGLLDHCTIVASDVSDRALEAAQRGVYSGRSFRPVAGGTAQAARERWFRREDDGFRIEPRLLEAVRFRRVNLVSDGEVSAVGRFDVILCRNVLIYFREETIVSVVGRLVAALAPCGVLVVGASESLLRFGTLLHCEELRGAFVYRNGGEAESSALGEPGGVP